MFVATNEDKVLMPISEQQFRRQFSLWHDRVYRYVACRLPTRDVCDDVVSEVFFEAWRKRETYHSEEGDIPGWLVGIARHKIADYWRQRRPEPWDDAAVSRLVDVQTPSPQYHYEINRMFAEVMGALPEETKALLMFRHKDGLTYEEIADIVGKTPAAVRQIFSRLNRSLRLQFPSYEFPHE